MSRNCILEDAAQFRFGLGSLFEDYRYSPDHVCDIEATMYLILEPLDSDVF